MDLSKEWKNWEKKIGVLRAPDGVYTYTVGDLKTALDNVPDRTPVLIQGNKGCSHFLYRLEGLTECAWLKGDIHDEGEYDSGSVPAVKLYMSK